MLEAPFVVVGKAVLRLAGWSALGLLAAEREMNVSTHFARRDISVTVHLNEMNQGIEDMGSLPIMVSSNSPGLSRLNSLPAPRAKTMLSLYSWR